MPAARCCSNEVPWHLFNRPVPSASDLCLLYTKSCLQRHTLAFRQRGDGLHRGLCLLHAASPYLLYTDSCPQLHAAPSVQGDSACVGAAQVQVTYPSLEAMVAYIQSRHAALKQVASTARGSLDMTKPLPLSHKAYLALITFLRQCRSKQKTLPDSPPQDYLGNASA